MNPHTSSAFRVGPAILAEGATTGPLAGLRLAVKDLIDVRGHRTGAGNPTFLDDAAIADGHAEVVERMLRAGASVIGKTHTDELAFSLAGTNIHYGTPDNPRAPGRIPGGSSSGSASAVAAGLADIALGTDTGGSIRIPASYCGIYGYRPTHGRVPVTGVVPLAPSFDTVGVLAGTGPNLAAAGTTLLDAPTQRSPTLAGLVVADDLLGEVDPADAATLRASVRVLAQAFDIPARSARLTDGKLESWFNAFRRRQLWEAWAAHGTWIEARQPTFGPGISERFAQAKKAGRPQPLKPFRDEVRLALERVAPTGTALVLPSAATVAPPHQPRSTITSNLRTRTLRLTCIAGLGGLPAISVPLAHQRGVPLGICLLGRPDDDQTLLSFANRIPAVMNRPLKGVTP